MMKACTSFWAGAIAGYLFGSSKQGIKWRGNLENLLQNLVGSDMDDEKGEAKAADAKGLDLEKAQELAEKLGAKVSEPEGENAIPYAHPIETSTSTLSA